MKMIGTVRELLTAIKNLTIEFYVSYGGGGYWTQARDGKLRQWDPSCSLDHVSGQLTGAGWTPWSERDHAITDGYGGDATGRVLLDPIEAEKDPATRGWLTEDVFTIACPRCKRKHEPLLHDLGLLWARWSVDCGELRVSWEAIPATDHAVVRENLMALLRLVEG